MSTILRPPLPRERGAAWRLWRGKFRYAAAKLLPWAILVVICLLLLLSAAILLRGTPEHSAARAGLFFFPRHASVTAMVGGEDTVYKALRSRDIPYWPAGLQLPAHCYGAAPQLRVLAGPQGTDPQPRRCLDVLAVCPLEPEQAMAYFRRELRGSGLRLTRDDGFPGRQGMSGVRICGRHYLAAGGSRGSEIERSEALFFTDDDLGGWTLFELHLWLAPES